MSRPSDQDEREAFLEPLRTKAALAIKDGDAEKFDEVITALMEAGYEIEAEVQKSKWDNAQEIDV